MHTGLETLPSNRNWGVNGDQDEEGAAEEFVEDRFGVNVCCYPSVLPSLCDEVKKVFCCVEGSARVSSVADPVRLWCPTRPF